MHIDYTPKEGEWPTYICSYRYKDAKWSFNIQAESAADAQARLRAIALANVDGQLYGAIELPLPKSTPKPIMMTIGNFLMKIILKVCVNMSRRIPK